MIHTPLTGRLACLALLAPPWVALILIGCAPAPDNAPAEQMRRQQIADQSLVEELFDSAIALLNDTEQLESTDLTTQVLNRLNQWLEGREPGKDWQIDPLVAELPAALRSGPPLDQLETLRFGTGDGWPLQESAWLRDAAETVTAGIADPRRRAEALFRWVVRHVRLMAENAPERVGRLAYLPREIMLLGQGTAVERGWLFMLLARQAGLDVVMLTLPGTSEEAERPWLPALFHGGELYLFDPQQGLPWRRDATAEIVTLRELRAEPALLEQWQGEPDGTSPIDAAQLDRLVVRIEGSPHFLAARFRLVEFRLSGDDRMTLSVDASGLANSIRQSKQIEQAGLWHLPLERAQMRRSATRDQLMSLLDELRVFRDPPDLLALWRGRVLHLRGLTSGEEGANLQYLRVRTGEEAVDRLLADNIKDPKMLAEARKRIPPEIRERFRLAREYATYWLGLLALERGNHAAAIDFLDVRLVQTEPKLPLKSAALEWIAEAQGAQGDRAAAIATYRSITGPARSGAMKKAQALEASAASDSK